MKSIDITNAKIIFSSPGEFGYKDVLNDFKTSKNIYIITYSISEYLTKKLKSLNPSTALTLITNLSINSEKTLTPEKYHDNSSFNFRLYKSEKNHAKIFISDNIAYIGSQNFYGNSNFECGFLINNKKEIFELKSKVLDEILQKSTLCYWNIDKNILFNKVLYSLNEIKKFLVNTDQYINKTYNKNQYKLIPTEMIQSIHVDFKNLMLLLDFKDKDKNFLNTFFKSLNFKKISCNQFICIIDKILCEFYSKLHFLIKPEFKNDPELNNEGSFFSSKYITNLENAMGYCNGEIPEELDGYFYFKDFYDSNLNNKNTYNRSHHYNYLLEVHCKDLVNTIEDLINIVENLLDK